MNDTPDGSLDLEAVRNRFAEAGKQLEAISQSASRLTSEAAHLADARTAVQETSRQVGGLASTLAGLAEELNELTSVLQQSDLTTMVQHLEQVRRDSTLSREDIRSMKGRIGDMEASFENTRKAVEQNAGRITALKAATEELGSSVDKVERTLDTVSQEVNGHLASIAASLRTVRTLVLVATAVALAAAILAGLVLVR